MFFLDQMPELKFYDPQFPSAKELNSDNAAYQEKEKIDSTP